MFTRITIDPAVCTGKPCIRGFRFPVARLLGLLAAGETRGDILAAYPYLETEDIDEALRYAASLAEDETADLDYPRLLALAGADGPGLVLFRAGDWGEAEIIARIQEVIDRVDAADLARSIVVVDRDRIRKRRLPIG